MKTKLSALLCMACMTMANRRDGGALATAKLADPAAEYKLEAVFAPLLSSKTLHATPSSEPYTLKSTG